MIRQHQAGHGLDHGNGARQHAWIVASFGRQGDSLALKALAEVGRVLGVIMSACTVILNPSRIVVGGGLGLAGYDFIVPAARAELMRRTTPEIRGLLEVLPSQVESPAIGAACLVWYQLSKEAIRN